jgi:hypothetical protein
MAYSDFISNDFADQGAIPVVEPPTAESAPEFAAPGDDFSLSSLEGEQGFALEHAETQTVTAGADFGDFAFGSGAGDADKTMAAAPSAPSASGTEDAGAFASGGIPMEPLPAPMSESGTGDAAALALGDEFTFEEKAPASLSGAPAEQFNFDTMESGSAASLGVVESAGDTNTPPAAAEPKAGESFNLDEFEFGVEQAAQPAVQKAPQEPEPSREALVETPREQPETEAGEDTMRKGPVAGAPPAAAEELPPLSIASRRKQGPLFGILIAVATVVAVAVLGFFGYTMFLEDKGKVVTETGRITVRAVNASFVKNPVIGDLLVITGEAVNSYTKPRAAIQIKGMVYDAGGKVLVAKNAYCGNPLTNAQLSTLSQDKIEAAMANQFGDSLSNMEVAPGKAIPFVIVIPKPPAEARDYGVEPAGSTVATGKQQ